MIGNFFVKKLIESKLKNISDDQKEKFFLMIENNPNLFQQIIREAGDKIKSGMGEMEAISQVVKRYEGELKKMSENLSIK